MNSGLDGPNENGDFIYNFSWYPPNLRIKITYVMNVSRAMINGFQLDEMVYLQHQTLHLTY